MSLTPTSDREAEVAVARANAIVNQFHVVNINAGAPAGIGRSVVVDPEGTVRYEAGPSEEVITTCSTSRPPRSPGRAAASA